MKNEGIKRTETYTENKAACYRLPNTTTMENLSMQVSAGEGAVLKMGDKVLVTDAAWKGFIAGVYEFIETPEETGFGYIGKQILKTTIITCHIAPCGKEVVPMIV